MSKYDPLCRFLATAPETVLLYTFTFSQIEQILGVKLPNMARRSEKWWANERPHGTHIQTQAWSAAGWQVQSVSPDSKWVRFSRRPLIE